MCLYNGFGYISLYSLTKAASPSSDNIIVLISWDMKGLCRTHNIWIGSLLRHQLCLHTDPVITVYSVPLHFPLYFSMERTVIPAAAVQPHTDCWHCFAFLWISPHAPHLLACPKGSAWLSMSEIPTLDQSTETWVILHMAAPMRMVVTGSHGCLLHPSKWASILFVTKKLVLLSQKEFVF